MTARSAVRLLGTTALLAGTAAVLVLAGTLIHHVASGSGAGLLLFAWSAGFAILLPVLLTMTAVLGPALHRQPRRAVIPNAGWKIPGAGQ